MRTAIARVCQRVYYRDPLPTTEVLSHFVALGVISTRCCTIVLAGYAIQIVAFVHTHCCTLGSIYVFVLNIFAVHSGYKYSSPRLVEDWMEELIVGLLLVENERCQKQSWSFMHLLCSGMVGFGLRRKLGTAGTERDSPLVLPPWPGGILILLAGFVLFSTVVFLGDLEIYFFVPVSRQ